MSKSKEMKQLKELYQEATTTGAPEYAKKLSDLMTSEKIQKAIKRELNDPNSSNVDDLILLLQVANIIDNNSEYETGMSDTEYDTLYDKLERMNEVIQDVENMVMTNPWFTTPVLGKKKGYHKYKGLRGTLDKIYYLTEDEMKDKKINKSRKGLPHFKNTVRNKLTEAGRSDINVDDLDIYVFPKFDGLSAIFEFTADGVLERVLTRGDVNTNIAEDKTHLFDFWVSGEKREHPYALKTEIHMEEDDYIKYNEKYSTNFKSSRQIVSSVMNSDEPDNRIKYLHIVPLRIAEMIDGVEGPHILSPKVFNYPYIKCKLKDTDKIEEFSLSHKYANGLRCDGAVIHIIDKEVQRILGRENDRDKFEVAYKFTEEIAYSKVTGIIFNPGIFGNITPTVTFKPVQLKGNTVSHASLGSLGIAKDLSLAKGDIIRVHYDIIPTVVYDSNDPHCKRSGAYPIPFPTDCPECGEPLTITDSTMSCTNPECDCRIRGRIFNYCQSMGMEGIGVETVDDLYYNGYLSNIKDLYKLKDHKKKLLELDGYGKKSINMILDEIERTKGSHIVDILNAIGIKGIRKKTYMKIFDYGINYDDLMDIAEHDEYERLTSIPDIGNATAKIICDGLGENKKLLKFLEKELDANTHTEKKDPNSKPKFTVVFTSIRDAELEKEIESLGGVIGSSVTKKTDLLIVPMLGTESTKVSKAESYNIPIVPIDDVMVFIKNNLL